MEQWSYKSLNMLNNSAENLNCHLPLVFCVMTLELVTLTVQLRIEVAFCLKALPWNDKMLGGS